MKYLRIRKENEIIKRVELNSKFIDLRRREYPLPIENGNCIIPEGITSIGDKCFNECRTLTNISLPSTLINIGNYSFSSWFRVKVPLKQVEVPKNCKIGEHAFEDDCKVIRK